MADEEESLGRDGASTGLSLSDAERRVLEVLRGRYPDLLPDADVEALAQVSSEAARGSLQRLRSKGLILADERHLSVPHLTAKGRDAAERGLPERRLLELIRSHPQGVRPEELEERGFTEDERSAAIGTLRRSGFLEPGVPLRSKSGPVGSPPALPEETVLLAVRDGTSLDPESSAFRSLTRRGLVTLEHHTVRRWTPSDEGRALVLESPESPVIGALTPEILASGIWQERGFRPYDVRATPPFLHGARAHPYLEWLREFEEILIGLGFEEAEGPLIETEFWNADVLFMPQDHPARSIHDMLTVSGVEGQPPPADLLERVAAAQEGRPVHPATHPLGPGWRAPYDRARSARPVARSQTTAVSARFLARGPSPPFRMYSIGRNFRRESVDATHHVEFDQCEGILGEAGVNLRHLVGLLRSIAEALRIPELRFRPSYFPFTEPSLEGYALHPQLGWVEVFPGGMLRPEVTKPLGVDVPVAAWGIGITRLAMVSLGVSDIRELFLDDMSRLTAGSG